MWPTSNPFYQIFLLQLIFEYECVNIFNLVCVLKKAYDIEHYVYLLTPVTGVK